MGNRIFVIEDDEDNRRILRDLLGRVGYEMIEAETGEARVAADLILTVRSRGSTSIGTMTSAIRRR
jgi:CheY-like chemotaxis protein